MKKVIKRDGRIEDFDSRKILKSVLKACEETGFELSEECYEAAEKTRNSILNWFDDFYTDSDTIAAEDLHRDVETVLMWIAPWAARTYITYRYRRALGNISPYDSP